MWVKNDAVSYPTLSFKDRVVSVAMSRPSSSASNRRLRLDRQPGQRHGCPGGRGRAAGVRAHPLRPRAGEGPRHQHLRRARRRRHGTYDDVNRLCSEIAGKYGWGFVNVNLRPFYAEGSKSYGYEVAEQLGWRLPGHVVVPMAGGSLVTKIGKAFGELEKLGLLSGARKARIHGAQAAGCAPDRGHGDREPRPGRPVKKPTSIAKSLAIGNPADGFYARQTIIGSGGFAADARRRRRSSPAMRLLAETEGIFAETAGGVTLGDHSLIERGRSAATTARSSSASPATA